MSLATVYAAAVASAQVMEPPTWTGPGGQMTSSVDQNGNCLVMFQGQQFTAPPAAMLNFAAWITATFT